LHRPPTPGQTDQRPSLSAVTNHAATLTARRFGGRGRASGPHWTIQVTASAVCKPPPSTEGDVGARHLDVAADNASADDLGASDLDAAAGCRDHAGPRDVAAVQLDRVEPAGAAAGEQCG